MMKTFIINLITISLMFSSCTGQNKFQTIDPNAYATKLATTPNAQLLDVRTPEEFAVDHIDHSVNVNWNGTDFVSKVSTYDKSKPVFVYCKMGGRSSQAAAKLAELGFKEIYNLEGGIMKWEALGLGKTSEKPIGMSKIEFEKILASNTKVLVDFSAKWCGPCQKMAPYIEKMKEEMKEELIIVKIDADENKTLCQELKLEGLPTLILYKNKREVWKNTGYISEKDLKKKL